MPPTTLNSEEPVIQASARAQIGAITDGTGNVEVFQMDGVGISK